MANLIKKVQNTIFQQELFDRGDKIVLAVSGGPDSIAMLDIFSKLKEKYSLNLIIAHVDYGLRGRDSKLDEKFVRDSAEKYSLKSFTYQPRIKIQSNLENFLRDIRYNFFEKIRRENKFDLIAVAHNSDDQVETFMMRVIRGSGLQGLSAIKYKNNRVIRPLLNASREEIIKYLKEKKLKYRVDKTNLEEKFARNKIRNQLLPYLEKNYNSKIKKTVFGAIESIAEDYDFIFSSARKEYQKNKLLSVRKILSLHPALQRQLLLLAIREKKSDLKNIESSHVREIIKILKSAKGKSQVATFKGLKITRRGDKLIMDKM